VNRRGAASASAARAILLEQLDAVIFDLDGVVTDTASIHEAAWKETFDAFLGEAADGRQKPFTQDDYRRFVDGKARIDGALSFLRSRGVDLPRGGSGDPPGWATVWGIANRKNERFLALLGERGGLPYPTTVALLEQLRARGMKTAIISASRNCERILRAAGIRELFDAKVDGVDAAELGLPGKPDPAVFLEAARRLGVEPARAAVVEDAIAGVQAGRDGRFGIVIGVDRAGYADALRDAGADVVVKDLGEMELA